MEHVCEIFDDAEMDFGCECEIRKEKKSWTWAMKTLIFHHMTFYSIATRRQLSILFDSFHGTFSFILSWASIKSMNLLLLLFFSLNFP